MNIFYLDESPHTAALYHCDKHVISQLKESAQMLSTLAQRLLPGQPYLTSSLYAPTHANHPCNRWLRKSFRNAAWLHSLALALNDEYEFRFNHTEEHLSLDIADHAYSLLANYADLPVKYAQAPFTPPPQCMPAEYKQSSTVRAYRAYYLGDKARFATWRRRGQPAWWSEDTKRNLEAQRLLELRSEHSNTVLQ